MVATQHPARDYSGQPFARPRDHFFKTLRTRMFGENLAASSTLLGQDSIFATQMSGGLAVYCGYVAGTFNNYNAVVAAHPGAKYVGIAPFIAPTDCLDVEPGDAVPGDCPAFFHQATAPNVVKPMIYTSAGDLNAVIAAMAAAGITRNQYLLWSAHWIGKHICSPASCGFPAADGTQYASNNSYDSDIFYAYVFPGAPPPPVPVNPSLPLKLGDIDATSSGPVHVVQGNLNKWASRIGLASPLAVDGDFGPATAAAVRLALAYWNYSAANVALDQVDQSLYDHLASSPVPPPFPAPVSLVVATRGITSFKATWHSSSVAGTDAAEYQLFVYHGVADKDHLVPSYPRTVAAQPGGIQVFQEGGLQAGTAYILHVVASGPNGTQVAPGVYAAAVIPA